MFKEITEIGKIDHIGIAVTDLTKSINYYRNLLNFNLINEKSLIEHDIKVAFLKKFETSIELLQPITFKSFNTKFLKSELFFVISSFRKAILEMNYDYGTKFNRSKIKTTKIQLPTINNKIDFALMKIFISAIHKLVIKDVVLYADRKKQREQIV